MFDRDSIILREIANGMMTMGAIVLLLGLIFYLIRKRYQEPRSWYKDIAAQGAMAGVVLVFGHLIRAIIGWGQFLWLHLNWNADWWANTDTAFVLATLFVVIGKLAAVYTFSPQYPKDCRARNTARATAAVVFIPAAVALLVYFYGQ